MSFEDWLKEVDAELEELRERNKKIIEEKKAKVKADVELYEKRMSMEIRVTKCYLVQVVDEEGNELKSEYVFCDNKKQAEQVGYDLREDILKEELK